MIRPTQIFSNSTKTKEVPALTTFNKTGLLFMGYYLLVVTIIGWKVTDTLITSANVIGHRTELRQLAQEQKELENSKNQLKIKISETYSLGQFDQSALQNFEPMHNLVSVNLTQYLAQR
jgi:hypothetical protein